MAETNETQSNSIRMYLFRYSIVPPIQLRIDVTPLPTPKGTAILPSIGIPDRDRRFQYWGTDFAFIGFRDITERQDVNLKKGPLYFGKLAKRRVIERGEYVPGDIVSREIDTWLSLRVVVDTVGQYIAVEASSDFGQPGQIQNALTAGLRPGIIAKYGCNIFVEPVSDPRAFWQIIAENESLYKIDLNLVSPNILDTNRAARESLASLKELFDQDEVTVSLENHRGQLKPNRTILNRYLQYIGNGEGWWSLTVKKLKKGRRHIYSSRSQIQVIETAPLPNELPVLVEDKEIQSAREESMIIDTVRSEIARRNV